MKIKSVKFADSFKVEVEHTVKTMLANNEKSRAIDLFNAFTVSLDDSYNDQLFHVFSGEEIGFKNIEKVFLFFK